MEQKAKINWQYIHLGIGLLIVALFWFVLPTPDPMTPVGMRIVGAFLMMVYLWSTVGSLWPSLLGLVLVACSGIDASGFNSVWLNSIGNSTVLLVLFAMILFGAVDEVGDTLYITRWILTRKVATGRPYVFLALFFFCCFVLAALISPICALIIIWPIAQNLMETLGIERKERLWKWFFVGMAVVMALAQPLLPFMPPQLLPIAAYGGMTGGSIPMIPYMLVDIIMTFLVMTVYLIAMKVLKVDLTKLKSVSPEVFEETLSLPPMDGRQKAFLIMIPVYLLCLLAPMFLPSCPVRDILNYLGTLGITVVFVLFFLVAQYQGKPMLDFRTCSFKHFDFGIFFMLAAAVYTATKMATTDTGVSAWLVKALAPILGGQTELGFVAIMFAVALVITNFANNGPMAIVLMPVVVEFSSQLGINPLPVAMGVILMVFVSMLTPAASPNAGMMWGRKDIYSPRDILSIGFPVCLTTLVLYIFVGYPLAKALCAMFGV